MSLGRRWPRQQPAVEALIAQAQIGNASARATRSVVSRPISPELEVMLKLVLVKPLANALELIAVECTRTDLSRL